MPVTHHGRLKRFIQNWIPFLVWASLIFAFSTDAFSSDNTAGILEPILRNVFPQLAARDIGRIHSLIRKFGHFSEYFLFARLLMRALRSEIGASRTLRQHALTILMTILYATSDELHQAFVPSRTASALDVLIDSIGGICGILSSYWRDCRTKAP
ncbi:MAG TPA: VanZ family protein [Candidatus Binatia bacterium]